MSSSIRKCRYKTASILLKDGVIRIGTRGTTIEFGLDVAHIPIFFLNETDNPEEIGLKALEALNGFKERGIPHPKNQEEWKIREQEWLKNLKITSSWRTFVMEGAKNLDLDMDVDHNIITVIPNKNLLAAKIKGEGDFESLRDKIHTCSTDPKELGLAILAAFNDCE